MTTETMPAAAPIETVTPIKPSEAIRLGCLIAPVQLRDDAYVSEYRRAACAFGAMALGYGYDWPDADREASHMYKSIRASGPCPAGGCDDPDFGDGMHLNDVHRWTRERIADWLEGLGL
jgi:hypothetical protein